MDDAKPQPICLSIGDLDFDLLFSDAQLRNIFSAYYAAFEREKGAGLPVYIHRINTPSDADRMEIHTKFEGNALTLFSGGYTGKIQAAGAELTIESEAPFVGVDYFFRTVVAYWVFNAGGILFHGAGIVRGERGYVFFGHSGSGKTTVASLSPGDIVLNDDLVILRPVEDGWQMYATPFWNPTQIRPTNSTSKLHSMYRLVKDKVVYRESMSLAQAVGELVANTPVYPVDGDQAGAVMERCLQLGRSVPVYWLHFLKDASFWNGVQHG